MDPFLYLNISCPSGSYDANVEPAKDDVLFTNSELLLGIIENFFQNIYGEVQPTPSKLPPRRESALKSYGIEMLLARKEAAVDLAPVSTSSVVVSITPLTRSASKSSIPNQSRLSSFWTSSLDLPPATPPHLDGEISKAIGHSITEHRATEETQAEAPPSLLPSHYPSANVSTEKAGCEPSSDATPVEGKPGWRGSMYAEDEDEEADLEIHLQGRAKSPLDLGLDGDENLRDVKISNPWAFAKLNAAMRPSGRNNQLHTPRRQIGDAGQSTDPSSDDLPQQVEPPLLKRPSAHVHPARSSPEGVYPTPSPFPFPQKARGKRKADDGGSDASSTAAPSTKERQKRGALDTWVQKSLGGYDELEDYPNTLPEDRGPPDLPYCHDFVTARSLPAGGIPLGEIPDSSHRPRGKPVPRRQRQGDIDRPFVPPVRDPSRVWFDNREHPLPKQHWKPRPNNDHQDPARAPTLILRDDEIEDDESVVPNSAERPLPPIHPDLAVTLDYEARKQKASEAHRKVLREQAAAAKMASKAQVDAPNPLHPQHTTSSPHRNRQAKAIAALHTCDIPPPPMTPSWLEEAEKETSKLEPSDPRAYLVRIHQQVEQAPESLRGRSKRQKTAMLPFETVSEETYTGDLTLMIKDVNVDDVEEDMKESGAWDRYVKSGEGGKAFEKAGVGAVKRWEGELREMVREMYAVKGAEGEIVNVDVDLSKTLRAHAAGFA